MTARTVYDAARAAAEAARDSTIAPSNAAWRAADAPVQASMTAAQDAWFKAMDSAPKDGRGFRQAEIGAHAEYERKWIAALQAYQDTVATPLQAYLRAVHEADKPYAASMGVAYAAFMLNGGK